MTVTLRKAAQIANQLLAQTKEIKLTNSKTFSIYHDVGTVDSDVETAKSEQKDRVAELRALYEAYGMVRQVIGKANAKSGVNDLLAEDAALSQLATRLSPLTGTPDLSNLTTVAQTMRKLSEKEENRYGESEVSITYDTLFANDELKRIKKRRAEIADQLLVKNTATKVELPEEVDDLVTKYKL